MQKKESYSKKILALLASKPAVSTAELISGTEVPTEKYAINRSLKGLQESGLIETHHSGQQSYSRLTPDGKRKVHSLKLESESVLFDPTWDGKWRIVMLDLPEDRKSERDGLRYLLKKAGFVMLKNSVWISPHPFEHLFRNIKKDLGLTHELMIFTTDTVDEMTEEVFLKSFHEPAQK